MSVPPALQGPASAAPARQRRQAQHGLLVVFSERLRKGGACLQAGTSVWNSTLVAGDASLG